jgi:hypothetical protein
MSKAPSFRFYIKTHPKLNGFHLEWRPIRSTDEDIASNVGSCNFDDLIVRCGGFRSYGKIFLELGGLGKRDWRSVRILFNRSWKSKLDRYII